MTPAPITSAIAPTVDPPLDVLTRRRLFYYQEDYILAPLAYPALAAPGPTYDEYLTKMVEAVTDDLSKFETVLIAPFRLRDFDTWAASHDLDPDSVATRDRYLATYDYDDLVTVTNPDVLYALSVTDYFATCAIQILHDDMPISADQDEHMSALEDLMEEGDDILNGLLDFLATVTSTSSIVSYEVQTSNEDNPDAVVMAGNLDVVRCHDHVHAESPQYIASLHGALSLSLLTHGSFLVRCFEVECHPRSGHPLKTVYGFHVTSDGIRGLSTAELFNQLCTDANGDIIPPEEGVTCADASAYTHQ